MPGAVSQTMIDQELVSSLRTQPVVVFTGRNHIADALRFHCILPHALTSVIATGIACDMLASQYLQRSSILGAIPCTKLRWRDAMDAFSRVAATGDGQGSAEATVPPSQCSQSTPILHLSFPRSHTFLFEYVVPISPSSSLYIPSPSRGSSTPSPTPS